MGFPDFRNAIGAGDVNGIGTGASGSVSFIPASGSAAASKEAVAVGSESSKFMALAVTAIAGVACIAALSADKGSVLASCGWIRSTAMARNILAILSTLQGPGWWLAAT